MHWGDGSSGMRGINIYKGVEKIRLLKLHKRVPSSTKDLHLPFEFDFFLSTRR